MPDTEPMDKRYQWLMADEKYTSKLLFDLTIMMKYLDWNY